MLCMWGMPDLEATIGAFSREFTRALHFTRLDQRSCALTPLSLR